MLAFRPITRGRLYRSRLLFWLLFAAALIVYALTAPNYAAPGASAQWMVWSIGADIKETPTYPLFSLLGRTLAAAPYLTLPHRLNLLSALFGALAVAWVYSLVWFITFELMREESSMSQASRLARFGGIVTALAVGTSLPLWHSATHFHPQIFEVALLLACFHLLTVYARTWRLPWLTLMAALYGVGVAESPLFLLAAPLFAAALLLAELKSGFFSLTRIAAALFIALAAWVALSWWSAVAFVAAADLPSDLATTARYMMLGWRDQLRWLPTAIYTGSLWLPAYAVTYGTAIAAYFVARRSLNNRRSWSTLILSLFLAVATLLLLFNAPFTLCALYLPQGTIPVAAYLVAGIGIGLVILSWRVRSAIKPPHQDHPDDDRYIAPSVHRLTTASTGTGTILWPLLTLALLLSILHNYRHLRADDGSFADRAAAEIHALIPNCHYLLSNGLLDPNLLLTYCQPSTTTAATAPLLLAPNRARAPLYRRAILRAVAADPLLSEREKSAAAALLPHDFSLFVDTLFAADSSVAAHTASIVLPDLYYGVGLLPIPHNLLFYGRPPAEHPPLDDLLTSHQRFWQRWLPNSPQRTAAARLSPTAPHYLALLRHLSFVANNLGVLLLDYQRTPADSEAAYDLFQQALVANPDNISALLNAFRLVADGLHPEAKPTLEAALKLRVEKRRDRYPLWALSRYFGYVRDPELFVRMGWHWALSSNPQSILAGLRSPTTFPTTGLPPTASPADTVSAALRSSHTGSAHSAPPPTATLSTLAALYQMQGDLSQSRSTYRELLAADPRNITAVSGLTRLAMQEGNISTARQHLQVGEAAGILHRALRLDWAAVQFASGDLPEARIALQELCEAPDAPAIALAMLSLIMLEQGDLEQVEHLLLPRLFKAAGSSGPDNYFLQVVQGRLWQSKGAAYLTRARDSFLRAARLRPDVHGLADLTLALDVALKDQKSAEQRALLILRQRPAHPFANYVLGTIRLQEGQYGAAQDYLVRSVAAEHPTLAALNNYAETLLHIRCLPEAQEYARRAIDLEPERYEGWSTLATVLTASGEHSEATTALTKARSLNASDPRLDLIEAQIAINQNDLPTAQRALSRHTWQNLTPSDQRLLTTLRHQATN